MTGEWSDPDRGEIVPVDEPRSPPPDLLQLADEAIDACDDASARLTFSAWEVAGEKVRAYREARRKGAVKAPGQCCAKLRESQGASIGLPSGISFCPWCGVRQTPVDLTLAPGRPVYP